MENKRGMSAVVVTIIMIVLVLGAISVVWVVVSQLLEGGTSDIEQNAQCIKISVVATAMVCGDTTCDVTLNRKAGGEIFDGLKLIFSNSVTNSVGETVETFEGNIPELGTKKLTNLEHGLTGEQPDTVEVIVYFTDESDRESICPQGRKFKF